MYIKKIDSSIIQYSGGSMGMTWMLDNGWLKYEGILPINRLDIIDGTVIELPEPEPINIYKEWYKNNPDLEKRVREYSGLLKQLGLPPTATTDQIAEVIQNSTMSDIEKTSMIFMTQVTFNNVVLNLDYLGVERPQYTAWAEMPYLIVNLPNE